MRLTWVLTSVLLLAGSSSAWAQASSQIPPVHGAVLTGDTVNLPDALKGKSGVLVLGFSQAAREQVTAWGKRLAGDYRGSSTVVYFEMPVVESVPKLLRGWVMKKMAESVPDRAKGTFLPIADHEREWKALAGYKGSDDAYVLIVDSEGVVRETVTGTASDDKYAQLRRRVDQMQAVASK